MGAIRMNLPADLHARRADAARQLARQDAGQRQRFLEVLGRTARRQHRRAGLERDRRGHRALRRSLHDHGHGFHHDQPGRDARASVCRAPPRSPRWTRITHAWPKCRGRRIVEMVWEDLKPRDILTAASFDNAIAVLMALGGSTNAIVHLVAMAGRAGITAGPRPLRRDLGARFPCSPMCGRQGNT